MVSLKTISLNTKLTYSWKDASSSTVVSNGSVIVSKNYIVAVANQCTDVAFCSIESLQNFEVLVQNCQLAIPRNTDDFTIYESYQGSFT